MIKAISNTITKGARLAKSLGKKSAKKAIPAAKKVHKLSESAHEHGFLGDIKKLQF